MDENNPREELFNTMIIKNSKLWELPKNESNKILLKKIDEIKKLLYEFSRTGKLTIKIYDFSSRQNITNKLAREKIARKSFVDAYHEMVDFIDDYGDRHDGKIFVDEKKTLDELLNLLKDEIEEEIVSTRDIKEPISSMTLSITLIHSDGRALAMGYGQSEKDLKFKITKHKKYIIDNDIKFKIIKIEDDFIIIKTNSKMNIRNRNGNIEAYGLTKIRLDKNKITRLSPSNIIFDLSTNLVIKFIDEQNS